MPLRSRPRFRQLLEFERRLGSLASEFVCRTISYILSLYTTTDPILVSSHISFLKYLTLTFIIDWF